MMPEPTRTLDEVVAYWDARPVHSVEFGPWDGSARYFREVDRCRLEDNERWAFRTFYDLPGGTGAKLLDAGCGVGFFTRLYARKGFDVHAVDIAPSAAHVTRQSLALEGLPGKVLRASVEDLPFPDKSFDLLVSNGVIHHTPDTEKAVAEFHRVLRPGGLASVCVYYRNALLRPPLWSLVRLALPLLLRKSGGRKMAFTARTPEDLARVYDGDGTPIAKLYTRIEAARLFRRFEIVAMEPHYFPARFLRLLTPGGRLHEFLDRRFGVLLYVLLRKGRET